MPTFVLAKRIDHTDTSLGGTWTDASSVALLSGDLCVLFPTAENGTNSATTWAATASTGLTFATLNAPGDHTATDAHLGSLYGECTADGNYTISITPTPNRSWRKAVLLVFRKDSSSNTWSVVSNAATVQGGSGAAVQTGTYSNPSGDVGVAVGGLKEYSAVTISNPGTGWTWPASIQQSSVAQAVYRLLTGGESVQVSITPSAAAQWLANMAVIKEVSASGTAPAITVQPTNQAANEGATATFSFTATGTGSLTAQARKNGTDIGSPFAITTGVSANYTTPTLTLADSGSTWDFVVTGDTAPTATTNAAAVTVNATSVASGGWWS